MFMAGKYIRKPISGFPGYEIDTDGVVYNRHGRALKFDLNDKGYPRARLMRDGVRHRPKVHKLVLETFARRREPHEVCRHLNGDKLDNRLENLCWGTHSENYADSVEHGTASDGFSKLTEEDVRFIRASGFGVGRLATFFGVAVHTIHKVRAGNSYSWVTDEGGEDEPEYLPERGG